MRIEHATPADLSRLLAIRYAAFAAHAPAAYSAREVETLLADVDEGELRTMIDAGQLLVARMDHLVAGLAGWKDGRLRHVYVDPAYTRRGIASRLLRRVEENFSGEVRAGVALHAEAFYLANGYRVVRRATAWDGSAYLEMVKGLASADMTRVLVTGAAGLIGSAVLDLLAGRGVPATALVLAPAGRPLPADRVIVGDARDPDVVTDGLRDADAVIHLAAIPAPDRDPDALVFAGNTQATFTVLDQAGRAGVRRAAIASSYAICGLPFARRPLRMPYLPIDAALPVQASDPYALSKQVDEATAAMMSRQYGMSVVAMRLPFIGAVDGRLPATARHWADDPRAGAADVWSYLDVRDAARAMVAALDPAEPGHHVVYVAAPETLAPYPTEELLEKFHPGVPHPPFAGRTVPIDLAPARDLLGFTAEHVWEIG
jgi:nucleoside-diphosphate-sugar epimerase/GNAT superfamily N-acetyltransferase